MISRTPNTWWLKKDTFKISKSFVALKKSGDIREISQAS